METLQNKEKFNLTDSIKAAASKKTHGVKPLIDQLEATNRLITLFKNGATEQSKSLAIAITDAHPKSGIVWKILGTIYQIEAQNDQAIIALKNALALLENDHEVHYNLANAYFDTKQLNEAIFHYQETISYDSDFLKAHFNLANVYRESKQYDLAELHLNKVIEIDAECIEAYLKLSELYVDTKTTGKSIDLLKKVSHLTGKNADVDLALAIEFHRENRQLEANESFKNAINNAPDSNSIKYQYALFLMTIDEENAAETLFLEGLKSDEDSVDLLTGIGILYMNQKKTSDAEHYLKKAIIKHPDSILGYINYGILMLNTGEIPDSAAYFLKALEIEPDNIITLNNLGLSLNAIDQFDEARIQFERVLAIDPDYVAALSNIATPLKRLGRLSEAESYLKHALTLSPDSHDLLLNLAATYHGMGLIEKAVEYNLKTIAIKPDSVMSYTNMLFDMSYSSVFTKEVVKERLHSYGALLTKLAKFEYTKWQHDSASNKIKIGFVSADLFLHPVTTFLLNMLQKIGKEQFEVVIYCNNAKRDLVTQQVKECSDQWHSIVGISDEGVAKRIHSDHIDILIDLSGHTSGNRLNVFAYKPAPVQMTWLGYWASTGVEQMDYILLDKMSAPVSFADQFTEKIKYIPDTRFCFSAPDAKLQISPLPAIKNGHITIGTFHNFAKVNDEVLAAWAEVLKQIPTAILRWQTTAFQDVNIVEKVKTKFSDLGVSADRLSFFKSMNKIKYMETYADIDFVLDCFPFTACTTTSDALWLGVPTLTIAGERLVSRQSASLMNAVGLPEWIAKDKADYVQKAVKFANDIDYLSQTRKDLRAKLLDSPLGDGQLFARNFEHALKEVWETYKSDADSRESNELIQDVKTKTAINIISATRLSETTFWEESALGLSILKLQSSIPTLTFDIAFENTQGLPEVFNACIDRSDDDATLIFMHDDVWINDENLEQVVEEGLAEFDVIGVAGNKRRLPKQPGWAFIDESFKWDDLSNLSGKLGSGKTALSPIDYYGKVPAACELLDGLFLAVKKSTLMQLDVRFDTRFKFHFYDMDFCRATREKGLTLGTWDIKLTHQSGGAFGSENWNETYEVYLNKWERKANLEQETIMNDPQIALDEAITDVVDLAWDAEQSGDIERAKELYQEVLEIAPNHIMANRRIKHLALSEGITV